jgi:phosphate transport system protein
MKVNNDLERMGDLAVNVADRAIYLCKRDPLVVDLDFAAMGELARRMAHMSLDCLINLDANLAREIIRQDDELDSFNRDHRAVIIDLMRKDPQSVDRALQMLFASRHLERIGDLAVNIAEDVIFMVVGEVVRHRHAEHLAEYAEGAEAAAGADGDAAAASSPVDTDNADSDS